MASVTKFSNARGAKQVAPLELGHVLSFRSGSVDMSIQAVAPEMSTTAAEVLWRSFYYQYRRAMDRSRTTW